MKSNRLAEIIVNPGSCTPEEVTELAMLAQQYPYSSAIHILNAKLASVNNAEGKDMLLTRAAISSPDRLRLKQFITTDEIYGNYNFIKSDPGVTGHSEDSVAETAQEDVEEKIPEKTGETEIIPEEKSQDATPEETAILPEQPEQEISEKKPDEESPRETGKTVRQSPEDKPAVIHEIDKNSIPRTEPEGRNVADEIMKNLASYREIKAKFENIIKDTDSPSSSPGTEKTEKESDLPDSGEDDPPEDSSIDNMEDVEEKFRKIIKPIQKKKSTKKMGKEEQDKLINKFIETDSTASKSVKPETREKKSDQDLSLPSSELKDEMITETLANILVNQGKLEKAIDIYRKLIWKLPQKKAYFAAKIESLKEKLSKK